jgi:hypothetical protein
MIRLVPYAVLMVLSFATLSEAQNPDPRDYEASYFAPTNLLQIQGYARHISTSDTRDFSQSIGLLRFTYVLKFGNLVFVPVNLIQGWADVSVYNPDVVIYSPVVNMATKQPEAAKATATTKVVHASGLMDIRYFPTIIYNIVENPITATHTTIALSPYVFFATGAYDNKKYFNIGENRITIIPQFILGQRLAKVFTLEAYGSPVFRTDNKSNLIPPVAALSIPNPTSTTLSQDMGLILGAIATVDLSKEANVALTYNMESTGKKTVKIPLPTGGIYPQTTPSETLHSLRFTLTMNVTPMATVLLVWSEDIAKSPDTASKSRYIGARFTQRFMF